MTFNFTLNWKNSLFYSNRVVAAALYGKRKFSQLNPLNTSLQSGGCQKLFWEMKEIPLENNNYKHVMIKIIITTIPLCLSLFKRVRVTSWSGWPCGHCPCFCSSLCQTVPSGAGRDGSWSPSSPPQSGSLPSRTSWSGWSVQSIVNV